MVATGNATSGIQAMVLLSLPDYSPGTLKAAATGSTFIFVEQLVLWLLPLIISQFSSSFDVLVGRTQLVKPGF